MKTTCPICNSEDILLFVEIPQVPVHCNLLCSSHREAINTARGDIRLGFCRACGHIFNVSFNPDYMKYNQKYDNSLFFSPRFQAYANSLAAQMIIRYDLRNKDIIEIGCGKGDFLILLCRLGKNRGIGFDPSYVPDRVNGENTKHVSFIQDFYSDDYADYNADFICCRHVLEHIQFPRDFLNNLRYAIGKRHDTVIFFEVPNVLFTLRTLGIWDIIYEHYSYFGFTSLSYIFNSCGFEVSNIRETFEEQFLCIDALPVEGKGDPQNDGRQEDIERMAQEVTMFSERYKSKMREWRRKLEKMNDGGEKAVIWGGGSKGVSFLNMLKVQQDQIEYVVDINPYKQGKYIPGTGQKIVPPEYLYKYKPHNIIVVNPVYLDEIRRMTESLNISARLLTI